MYSPTEQILSLDNVYNYAQIRRVESGPRIKCLGALALSKKTKAYRPAFQNEIGLALSKKKLQAWYTMALFSFGLKLG